MNKNNKKKWICFNREALMAKWERKVTGSCILRYNKPILSPERRVFIIEIFLTWGYLGQFKKNRKKLPL